MGVIWGGRSNGGDWDGWWTHNLDSRCPPVGFARLHFWQLGAGDTGLTDLFECRALLIRHWLLACMFALTPIIWLVIIARDFRQERRHRSGHCLRCGYNLTGNISGVCPECGTATPAARTHPN